MITFIVAIIPNVLVSPLINSNTQIVKTKQCHFCNEEVVFLDLCAFIFLKLQFFLSFPAFTKEITSRQQNQNGT